MIEYIIIDVRKDYKKWKGQELAVYLNYLASEGWRVKCSFMNTKLLLSRKVKKKEVEED